MAAAQPPTRERRCGQPKRFFGKENLFSAAGRPSFIPTSQETTMNYALIRYGVKQADLEDNRALVEKVFEALGEAAPPTVRYLVLELDDGSFVHIVGQDGDSSALTGLAAFKAFTENHAQRRSTPAMRSPVKVIGNYRMLADQKAG
ncbi:hypothetical protein X772_33550 [Mesorhizobium sp. LSJC280B00]|nr:hypothetical protein X772_33550 [Mesorhizobium sp. LSJC280B00]